METNMEDNSKVNTSKIYITALDNAVNVNSLFMFAVFIGLAGNPTDPDNLLIEDPTCIPDHNVSLNMISFHVFSFASFLFSSIIALSIKQTLKISRTNDQANISNTNSFMTATAIARINKTMLRLGILMISIGSICGCGFLTLALVNLIQLKVGTLNCPSNNSYAVAAVIPLVILVPAALLINVGLVFYAFTR